MPKSPSRNAPSARQVARWRSLSRRKGREREGLFLIEGERAVSQVLGNGRLTIEAILLEKGYEFDTVGEVSVAELDRETFQSISCTQTPQGVMAVAMIPPEHSLEELKREKGLVLATDGIQDPGNLGTLIRTAIWFGVKGVLLGKGTVDLWNPKVVRSTAGATGILPCVTGELSELLVGFEQIGWQTALLDAGESSLSIREYKATDRQVIVVGNEGNGIRREILEGGSRRSALRIDGRADGVESLNASVAASIALYELTRSWPASLPAPNGS